MHELGIAQEVVEIAERGAEGARVRRVVVEVGRLAAVVPDALRFCFDVAKQETLLGGATLDIIEVPGRARCRSCGSHFELSDPLGACACGGIDLEWLSGTELNVKELEVG